MKRIISRLLIVALTFIIGLTSVWLAHKILRAKEALPGKLREISAAVPAVSRPKFKPTFRACGAGYAQVYELPDGRRMSEGSYWFISAREAKRDLEKLLAKARLIVERVPQFQNRFGKAGERIVALFPLDKEGRGGARVLWHGGGQYYLYIEAPSLEIALEFERANAYAF